MNKKEMTGILERYKSLSINSTNEEILNFAADAMDAAAHKIKQLQEENERLYGILEPFACDCDTHCKEYSYGCDNWLAQKAFDVKMENER